jgi:hypothetical protein
MKDGVILRVSNLRGWAHKLWARRARKNFSASFVRTEKEALA